MNGNDRDGHDGNQASRQGNGRANDKRQPVYIRPDYHQILKLRSFLENKKLYQLTEELLTPHIERYKTSKAILEREAKI